MLLRFVLECDLQDFVRKIKILGISMKDVKTLMTCRHIHARVSLYVRGLYTIPVPSNKPDLPDGRKFYVIDNQIKEYINDNLCCYE